MINNHVGTQPIPQNPAEYLTERIWAACGRVSAMAVALHERAELTDDVVSAQQLEVQDQALNDGAAIISAEILRWREEVDPK